MISRFRQLSRPAKAAALFGLFGATTASIYFIYSRSAPNIPSPTSSLKPNVVINPSDSEIQTITPESVTSVEKT